MNFSKIFYPLAVLLILAGLLLQNTGCEKEYSYEGIDSIAIINPVIPDSVKTLTDSVGALPKCALCNANDVLSIGTWNFKTGNSFVCGGVTNSGFFNGYTKMDITFFGPSACSGDTGLVMSVFFPVPLDQDRFNITATNTAFYYYDNNAPKDIFISQPEKPFTVTLQSFIYATGIATGTFSGTVFKATGDTAYIAEGKYKVKIR